MQSVFVIITKIIACKHYFCKEFFCNNFGRDGTRYFSRSSLRGSISVLLLSMSLFVHVVVVAVVASESMTRLVSLLLL